MTFPELGKVNYLKTVPTSHSLLATSLPIVPSIPRQLLPAASKAKNIIDLVIIPLINSLNIGLLGEVQLKIFKAEQLQHLPYLHSSKIICTDDLGS